MKLWASRRLSLLVSAVVVGVAVGGIAYASIPDNGGVIHGCYRKDGNHQLRVIDSAKAPKEACSAGEKSLNWSQTGPAGATGATGATGPTGAKGESGDGGKSLHFASTTAEFVGVVEATFLTGTFAGGPSVTVDVPENALVHLWVAGEMKVECNVPQVDCPVIWVEVASDDGGCPFYNLPDRCATRIVGKGFTLPPNEYGPAFMGGEAEDPGPGMPPATFAPAAGLHTYSFNLWSAFPANSGTPLHFGFRNLRLWVEVEPVGVD